MFSSAGSRTLLQGCKTSTLTTEPVFILLAYLFHGYSTARSCGYDLKTRMHDMRMDPYEPLWHGCIVIPIKNWFSIMIDWSVIKNQFFDLIINFQSYMIDLFIFLWSIFQFFWQVFTIHVQINSWPELSNPNLEIYSYVCGPVGLLTPWNSMKSVNKRSIIDQWVHQSFLGQFFD